ncbi:hypothetical protein IEQ34_007152 [Dendrobium chrysotoxum]|uniref:Uncharacterized protein n=1 Tax=Dendrobium chrysotoxum TaxID=161865 RepID=A0AAV7H629_DENCH|nr:hypothetical protein IEQ34_007152 [Dendrobium chrysotoxum]
MGYGKRSIFVTLIVMVFMAKLGTLGRSGFIRKTNDSMRLIMTTFVGFLIGFLIGISFPSVNITKLHFPSSIASYNEDKNSGIKTQALLNHAWISTHNNNSLLNSTSTTKIYVSTNPKGAERLPPEIIVPESDFYLRRLWGNPSEDLLATISLFNWFFPHVALQFPPWFPFPVAGSSPLWLPVPVPLVAGSVSCAGPSVPSLAVGPMAALPSSFVALWLLLLDNLLAFCLPISDWDLSFEQKYLVTFTVGYEQKKNIDAAVKKFSGNFTLLLFHYDGRTSEWDEFEWSKRAIHVSARKQTKWWYAKRFLHPNIVAPYEYIFIWDEDLGLEHFNAERYIELVKKHDLEISQPGLEPNNGLTWQMTKRRGDREVHKETEERPGWCTDPHLPPCAAFVEIMAPVFSRNAWKCVWHMIQNDLVHGWGLDFALRKCVEPAHEKIGVVDSQWIVHQVVPSLGNQGQSEKGKAPWEGVRERCRKEWGIFQTRLADAEKAYYKKMGIAPPNATSV